MSMFTRQKIRSSFTKVCSIAVTFMIGYWIYKYKFEDRDIAVVDYLVLNNAKHIEMPVPSICFKNPFINENFEKLNENKWRSNPIDRDTYLEYLKGNSFDAQFEQVDYHNVTLDLGKYFLYLKEQWHNQSSVHSSSLIVEHDEVFSGFFLGRFLKCFTLKYDIGNNRHIKGLRFYYDLKTLIDDWKDFGETQMTIYFKIHYPGQFFLGTDPGYKYLNDESYSVVTWIKELEMLESRNSENRKCSIESTAYDKMIYEKYLSTIGCKVPYLGYESSVPPCNMTKNGTDLKLDYYEPEILHIPRACKRISKMRTNTEVTEKKIYQRPTSMTDRWYFMLYYPKDIKVITQSKEVDFHALIGNIGGYLGLFLGNFFDNLMCEQCNKQLFSLMNCLIIL